MENFAFDSQNEFYKRPFGALSTQQQASFAVRVLRTLGAAEAFLVLREDGGEPLRIPMRWADLTNGYDVFACDAGPLPAGLYWYWFEAGSAGLTEVFGAEKPWQLTVYDAVYSTPDWFDGGIVYHIFVDRFRRAGEQPLSRPGRPYKLHGDWYEDPDIYPSTQIYQNFDFFGGNLRGIEEKLDYIRSLGTSTIYLSPIFESFSNHRYDTGDFLKIDPIAGDEEDFRRLCAKARAKGMRVILDGVFNHTGADSRYFNALGLYDAVGAAQSEQAPCAAWYSFRQWPDDYECWWGVKSLPAVNKTEESYVSYTLTGEDSVVRHWLKAGASGYRLDVVDELPRGYVETLRSSVKQTKPDAVVIGEVWEDASNKTSYGERRRYFLGAELDGATNYPAKDAIIGFLRGTVAVAALSDALLTLHENYPPPARRSLMNILGTHDTIRILNVLGCEQSVLDGTRTEKAAHRITDEERLLGKQRLLLACALQYMLPGAPCVYYGDEAGLEGFEDPQNRRGYPWGREDSELLAWYRTLGQVRREHAVVFAHGDLDVQPICTAAVLVSRRWEDRTIFALLNRGTQPVPLAPGKGARLLAGQYEPDGDTGAVPPLSVAIFIRQEG